jgi:hypothetical protein
MKNKRSNAILIARQQHNTTQTRANTSGFDPFGNQFRVYTYDTEAKDGYEIVTICDAPTMAEAEQARTDYIAKIKPNPIGIAGVLDDIMRRFDICAGLIATAIAAPAIVLTIVAVILLLCLILFILREFGVALP